MDDRIYIVLYPNSNIEPQSGKPFVVSPSANWAETKSACYNRLYGVPNAGAALFDVMGKPVLTAYDLVQGQPIVVTDGQSAGANVQEDFDSELMNVLGGQSFQSEVTNSVGNVGDLLQEGLGGVYGKVDPEGTHNLAHLQVWLGDVDNQIGDVGNGFDNGNGAAAAAALADANNPAKRRALGKPDIPSIDLNGVIQQAKGFGNTASSQNSARSDTGAAPGQKPKRKTVRLSSHKQAEQRSRDKLRNSMKTLMLEIPSLGKEEKMPSKAAILEMAAEYIRKKNIETRELVEQLRKTAAEAEEKKNRVNAINQDLKASSFTTLEITDQNGMYTYVNENWCRIFGFVREEVIGKLYRENTDCSSCKIMDAKQQQIDAQLKRGEDWRGMVLSRSKDGVALSSFCVINPVLGPNGEVFQYVCVRSRFQAIDEDDVTEKCSVKYGLSEDDAVDNSALLAYMIKANIRRQSQSTAAVDGTAA
eukprot:Clim_evm21s200 gene=Clim_evmTU21s200